MMMRKENNKQILIWGKPRDITTDTTNKGFRAEIHATAGGRRAGLYYRIFSLHVDLLDTTNKKFLLMPMVSSSSEIVLKTEPIR